LGGESQPKEPQRVPTNFPHQIPRSKVPETPQENHQQRAPKITTKNNREQHNKALRNHAESSIHATKVHTRFSLPPDHPTLSTRSHHEALKIVLWRKENRKANELGFQEMAAILSPHKLYGGNRKSKIPLLNN
jgi:hypothetical protein